jgi:hypothetical protein
MFFAIFYISLVLMFICCGHKIYFCKTTQQDTHKTHHTAQFPLYYYITNYCPGGKMFQTKVTGFNGAILYVMY